MNAEELIRNLGADRTLSVAANVDKIRVQQSIDVLQRVVDNNRAFNIFHWYDTGEVPQWVLEKMEDDAAQTEEELHACGTSACAMGWIAISPEWKAAGGEVSVRHTSFSMPYKNERVTGFDAAALWLGVNPWKDAPDQIVRSLFIRRHVRRSIPIETVYGDNVPSQEVLLQAQAAFNNASIVNPIHFNDTDAFMVLSVNAYDTNQTVTAQDVIDRLVHLRDTGTIQVSSYGLYDTTVDRALEALRKQE